MFAPRSLLNLVEWVSRKHPVNGHVEAEVIKECILVCVLSMPRRHTNSDRVAHRDPPN